MSDAAKQAMFRYKIIVDDVPVPHNTPWDDLLAFRSDADSQKQLGALRLWMADVAKSNLSYAEAADKVAAFKEEYRSHMRGAGIKMGIGTLEVFVVGVTGLIENAMKLKLKDLAEGVFKLIKSPTDLFAAERGAPGRQLDCLVRASNTFDTR